MKVIIWSNASGIRIEYPNVQYKQVGESDQAFCERMAAFIKERDASKAADEMTIMDASEVTKLDRSKRSDWRLDKGVLKDRRA